MLLFKKNILTHMEYINANLLTSVFFLIFGTFAAVKPKEMLDFRIKVSEKLLGLKIKSSKRAEDMYRAVGVFLIIVGLLKFFI